MMAATAEFNDIQGPFHHSLFAIGTVVSEELIFM
jgi:hypothetical protein